MWSFLSYMLLCDSSHLQVRYVFFLFFLLWEVFPLCYYNTFTCTYALSIEFIDIIAYMSWKCDFKNNKSEEKINLCEVPSAFTVTGMQAQFEDSVTLYFTAKVSVRISMH